MTADTVVLAQTRLGFPTEGRKKSLAELVQHEQTVQLEEAYARATVAKLELGLTMNALDIKDLLGFFSLHCRTSAKHGRSTTGIS